jgi:hypothetical protein
MFHPSGMEIRGHGPGGVQRADLKLRLAHQLRRSIEPDAERDLRLLQFDRAIFGKFLCHAHVPRLEPARKTGVASIYYHSVNRRNRSATPSPTSFAGNWARTAPLALAAVRAFEGTAFVGLAPIAFALIPYLQISDLLHRSLQQASLCI